MKLNNIINSKFLFLLLILWNQEIFAQISIKNAEDFSIGTTLVFQNCKTENIHPGKAGKNLIWDFSKLKKKENDTVIEQMVLPKFTDYDTIFPQANMVEKYSDGKLVFFIKDKTENNLLGFIDENSKIKIQYTDPMLFAKRPITFGDTITDKFKTKFNTRGMDFNGNGIISIISDGYGKLILPNKTYENVLRVKIVQKTINKIIQYNSESITHTTTYVWFDKLHTSALLKIDKTESDYFNDYSIQYLLREYIDNF
tara:strand:- start:4528 stop:5292 length:765 start_codon:yes stop_codon:yes gene_type:complete